MDNKADRKPKAAEPVPAEPTPAQSTPEPAGTAPETAEPKSAEPAPNVGPLCKQLVRYGGKVYGVGDRLPADVPADILARLEELGHI